MKAYLVYDQNTPCLRTINENAEWAKREMCRYSGLTWTQLAETGCRVVAVEIAPVKKKERAK